MHKTNRAIAVVAASGLAISLAASPVFAGAPARLKVAACSDPADGSLVVSVSWSLPGGGAWADEVLDGTGALLFTSGVTVTAGGERGSTTFDTNVAASSASQVVVSGYSVNTGSATATDTAPWRTCRASQLP